jgi:hypothetical protein
MHMPKRCVSSSAAAPVSKSESRNAQKPDRSHLFARTNRYPMNPTIHDR